MFDSGVVREIEGIDIDRPRNAMSIAADVHRFFGNFEIFFTPVPDQPPHTYRIESFLSHLVSGTIGIPVNRTLLLSPTRTIDPPSPRFLAIHRAIAHILHLSGAGDYIDNLLRDAAEYGVRADGSTDLHRLIGLVLTGWITISA